MHNIAGVTAFLRKKIIEEDGNPDQECLNLVPSNDGECYWMDECDHLWRVYLFIEGMSYDAIGTKLGISRVAVWNISTTWSFRACING